MQPTTSALGHLTIVSSRADDHPASAGATPDVPTEEPKVGLAFVDRLPLRGLGDDQTVQAVVAWASEVATALVGDGREAARLRLIARCIVSERARLAILEAMLDEQLLGTSLATNTTVVRELNIVISSTTRRLCALLREHAAACTGGARPAIVIGSADHVLVDAGKP